MPRKPRKGYFVRGEFVAEGSELDLELKRELKGMDSVSKTDRKRESAAIATARRDAAHRTRGPAWRTLGLDEAH